MALKIDWTDLQYVISVAKTGSLSAASRELGVNHSTVLRRISAFEQKIKVQLFSRDSKGYQLSPHGKAILKDVDNLTALFDKIEHSLHDYDSVLEGSLSLTTTTGMFYTVLKDAVFKFSRSYPGIKLHLQIFDQMVNLAHLESDIALRPATEIADGYFGQKIFEANIHVYAHRDVLSDLNINNLFDYERWIGFSTPMLEGRVGTLLSESISEQQVVVHVSSFDAVKAAIEAGLGIGLLPEHYVPEISPLVRVSQGDAIFTTPVYMMARKELQTSRKVNAFMNYIAKNFKVSEISG